VQVDARGLVLVGGELAHLRMAGGWGWLVSAGWGREEPVRAAFDKPPSSGPSNGKSKQGTSCCQMALPLRAFISAGRRHVRLPLPP
jgi:hypothetical protein